MPPFARLASLLLLSLSLSAHATQKGVTEKGDEILLEDNGTWRYATPPKEASPTPIGLNVRRMARSKDATFAVRSSRNTAVVYIDPKKWLFSKGKNPDQEFTFRMQSGDMYGVLITERITIPSEQMVQIVLSNLRNAGSEAEIAQQEYRYVNDKKVLYLRVNAVSKGLKLTYTWYLYSDDSGTTQLLVYTSQNLAASLAPDAEEFLNGLTFQTAP